MIDRFAVSIGDRTIALPGAQAPKILALLALESGRSVPHDRIQSMLWPEKAPPTAHRQISNQLSALRSILQSAGFNGLSTRNRICVLTDATTDVGQLDSDVNRARSLMSRQRHGEALPLLEQCAAMIPDEPMGGLGVEPFTSESVRLLNLREALRGEIAECLLREGRYREAVDAAQGLYESNVLSGTAVRLYMRALRGDEDQPRALTIFEEHRRRLADELGLDPDEETRKLHTRLLRERAPRNEPIGRVPRELPAEPHVFVGRDDEAATVSRALRTDDGRPRVAAVSGPGGIGKSALALHVAHCEAGAFPDGQVYIDLQGHSPGMEPVTPAEALRTVLQSFGVGTAAGESLRGLQSRFRTELADRRALLVLDNARDTAQVRRLIPGAGRSSAIVTARRPLALEQAGTNIHLEPLGHPTAKDLMTAYMGDRKARAHSAGVESMIRACGGLPLALTIAGSKCRLSSATRIDAFAKRLDDEQARLGALSLDDVAVKASIRASFEDLARSFGDTSDVVRLFHRLGLFPGLTFTSYTAGALIDADSAFAANLLEVLEDYQLVHMVGEDRFRFHDLVREYAGDVGPKAVDEARRDEALSRAVEFYAVGVVEAAATLVPSEAEYLRTSDAYPRNNTTLRFEEQEDAADWYRKELGNIVAVSEAVKDRDALAFSWAVIARLGVGIDPGFGNSLQWIDKLVDFAFDKRHLLSDEHRHLIRFSKHTSMVYRGKPESCLPILDEGQAEAAEKEPVEWRVAYLNWKSHTLRCMNENAEAYRLAADAVAKARELDNAILEFWALVRGAESAEGLGLADEACSLAEESITAARKSGNPSYVSNGRCTLAFRLARAGRVEESRDIFDDLLSPTDPDAAIKTDLKAIYLWGLGEALAGLGQSREAKARFDESVRVLYKAGIIAASELEAVRSDRSPAPPVYLAQAIG